MNILRLVNLFKEVHSLMGWIVDIDTEKCNGDEECVNVCPSGVLEMQDGKATVVNIEECLGCESCVEVCTAEAITLTET